jgi:hypothetical protein
MLAPSRSLGRARSGARGWHDRRTIEDPGQLVLGDQRLQQDRERRRPAAASADSRRRERRSQGIERLLRSPMPSSTKRTAAPRSSNQPR